MILYYLTSINSYSFGFLVFLFTISFAITKKQIKSIVIFRVILGILVFIFYFFGWESFGHHKYVPHKGEKITFSKTQMIQICNLPEVFKLSRLISYTMVYRYNCYISKKEPFSTWQTDKNIIIAGNLQNIPNNKIFTITDYIYVKTKGILLKSFAGGGEINYYILKDKNNYTYFIGKDYIEEALNE